jgi:hypothetical protein
VRIPSPLAHLLPNYDEYFVGLKDRSAFSARLNAAGEKARTSALSQHILTINGQIVGGWKRALARRTAVIEPKLLLPLSEAELKAVGAAARKLGRFLGMTAEVACCHPLLAPT